MARKRSLYGQYLLIQKVDEGVWYPGHVVPIVYVKITKDAVLPSSIEEYDKLEYVQTGFSKFEERFWPIDMNRPQEDIAEKSKIHYHVDAFGLLPQYRIELLNTSKRVIPPKLIYVGNYISDWPGDRTTVLSLTVEEDFSYLQNHQLLKQCKYTKDDLYFLVQMFSGDELHIVSKEVIAEVIE